MSVGARGLTLSSVLESEELQKELLGLGMKRWQASAEYCDPWFQIFERMFKLYHSFRDEVEDEDEPNTVLAYAYGIVEDVVSRVVEPILQMRTPVRVRAKRAKHQRSSENFADIAATYFHTARYQQEWTTSVREQIIVGNSWEFDGWSNEYCRGKRWAEVEQQGTLDKVRDFLGRLVPGMRSDYSYSAAQEVDHDYPLRQGYNVRFPSIFDVYPEPGVKRVEDMHWVLEQQRSVAIDDLKGMKYYETDPDTGKRVLRDLFDFSQMEEDVGEHEQGKIQPTTPDIKADYSLDIEQTIAGGADPTTQDLVLDMDKVHLLWVWERDRYWVIANQRYIVCYQERFYHVPRLPCRMRIYTPVKEFFFGKGVLEPVESQLYELEDIHNLAMANWVRTVNKMIAYDDEVVPFAEDDFRPRAGGRIRVRPDGRSIHDTMMPIDVPDVTRGMLMQESNTKGLIEREIQILDFAPGAEGTKPTHKTLGGLLQISRAVAQRLTTVRRMLLANFQAQMWAMEKYYSQFQYDPAPFTAYGPDGSTAIKDLDLWDIDTAGEGFDYVYEYDPSFGDDALLRNQLLSLFDQALKYENWRGRQGGPEAEKVDVPEIFRRVLQAYGWGDTTQVLAKSGAQVVPEEELAQMTHGQPVMAQPGHDPIGHLVKHWQQKADPRLLKAIASGRAHPKTMMLLDAHIEALTNQIFDMVRKAPQLAAAMSAQGAVAQAREGAGGGAPLSPMAPGAQKEPAAPFINTETGPGGFGA